MVGSGRIEEGEAVRRLADNGMAGLGQFGGIAGGVGSLGGEDWRTMLFQSFFFGGRRDEQMFTRATSFACGSCEKPTL